MIWRKADVHFSWFDTIDTHLRTSTQHHPNGWGRWMPLLLALLLWHLYVFIASCVFTFCQEICVYSRQQFYNARGTGGAVRLSQQSFIGNITAPRTSQGLLVYRGLSLGLRGDDDCEESGTRSEPVWYFLQQLEQPPHRAALVHARSAESHRSRKLLR